jgi:hypothetical protein
VAVSLDPHVWLVNILVRIDGPGSLRFVLQPLVAIMLGIRDGWRGTPSTGMSSITKPFVIALVVDAVLSLFVLGAIYPFSTLFVGVVLVALPYTIAREAARRARGLALWCRDQRATYGKEGQVRR